MKRKLGIKALSILFLLILIVSSGCTKSPVSEYLKLGDQYSSEGNMDAAIMEYSKAVAYLQSNPESQQRLALAYSNLGYAQNSKELWDNAIDSLDKAIELDPVLDLAFNNRGTAYTGKGKEYLTSALLAKDSGDMDKFYADLDIAIDLFLKAIDDLKTAVRLNKQLSVGFGNLAVAYNELGKSYNLIKLWGKAITALNFAIDLSPKMDEAYNNRGWAYTGAGLPKKAIPDLTKAIELNPDLTLAYCNRGWAYYEIELYDESIADLTIALEQDPALALAYLNRGIAYYLKGDFIAAKADFYKVLELTDDPEYIDAAHKMLYMITGEKITSE